MALSIDGTGNGTIGNLSVTTATGNIVSSGDSGTITAGMLDGGQTGSAPAFVIRAWVFFDGTGTVAINNSGNVSSITDNGTGDYTVNFTTALPSNYGVAGFSGRNANASVSGNSNVRSTSSLKVSTGCNDSGSMTHADVDSVSVVFYG